MAALCLFSKRTFSAAQLEDAQGAILLCLLLLCGTTLQKSNLPVSCAGCSGSIGKLCDWNWMSWRDKNTRMNHSGGGFVSRLSDDTAAPIDNFFPREEQASLDAKHQVD